MYNAGFARETPFPLKLEKRGVSQVKGSQKNCGVRKREGNAGVWERLFQPPCQRETRTERLRPSVTLLRWKPNVHLHTLSNTGQKSNSSCTLYLFPTLRGDSVLVLGGRLPFIVAQCDRHGGFWFGLSATSVCPVRVG